MVNFYLENRVSKKGEAPIRVSIAISGARLVSSTGYSVKPDDWNPAKREVKPKRENRKKETAFEINQALTNLKKHFDTYENDHGKVTEDELRQEFKNYMGRSKTLPADPNTTPEAVSAPSFFDRFDQFINEESVNNQWAVATKKAMNVIKGHVEDWNPNITFEDLNEATLSRYVQYHRTNLNQREVTVEKQWRYLKWFLDWATRKGYNTTTDYQRFHPKFKTTDKTIVFLDWKELMRLYNYKVPKTGTKVKLKTYEGEEYEKTVSLSGCLDRVKDMFCFCRSEERRVGKEC